MTSIYSSILVLQALILKVLVNQCFQTFEILVPRLKFAVLYQQEQALASHTSGTNNFHQKVDKIRTVKILSYSNHVSRQSG